MDTRDLRGRGGLISQRGSSRFGVKCRGRVYKVHPSHSEQCWLCWRQFCNWRWADANLPHHASFCASLVNVANLCRHSTHTSHGTVNIGRMCERAHRRHVLRALREKLSKERCVFLFITSSSLYILPVKSDASDRISAIWRSPQHVFQLYLPSRSLHDTAGSLLKQPGGPKQLQTSLTWTASEISETTRQTCRSTPPPILSRFKSPCIMSEEQTAKERQQN